MPLTSDLINALFELLGAIFTWLNAAKLYQDRDIKGVYWPTMAFFAAWGIWNLYYYPSLGQWASFSAGIILAAGNVVWVALALCLRLAIIKRPKHEMHFPSIQANNLNSLYIQLSLMVGDLQEGLEDIREEMDAEDAQITTG